MGNRSERYPSRTGACGGRSPRDSRRGAARARIKLQDTGDLEVTQVRFEGRKQAFPSAVLEDGIVTTAGFFAPPPGDSGADTRNASNKNRISARPLPPDNLVSTTTAPRG